MHRQLGCLFSSIATRTRDLTVRGEWRKHPELFEPFGDVIELQPRCFSSRLHTAAGDRSAMAAVTGP